MQVDNPYCKDAKGKTVYQSGNDSLNPNGLKLYFVKNYEVWAYNYKDAVMKAKAGLIHKQH